jgi:hypothetical protein
VQGLRTTQVRGGACLLIEDRFGQPVWPICDDSELQALARLCELLGHSVVSLFPSDTQPLDYYRKAKRVKGGVAVRGKSEELDGLGLLYAHLTGRSFVGRCDNADDLYALGADIVILLYESLSIEFIESLSGTRETYPTVGLIAASSLISLRRQVLLRAAALKLSANQCARILEFRAHQAASTSNDLTVVQIDKGTDPKVSRKLLSEGREVVAILSHSDGIDMYIAPGLTLCGMDRYDGRDAASKRPSCAITGQCYRWPTPLTEIRQAPWFVSPDEPAAGILLLNVCSGYLASGAAVDNRWGYLRGLLDRSVTGAIVTTWQIVITDSEGFDRVLYSLRRGTTIGKTIYRHNQTRQAKTFAHAYCLFGDPQLRFKRDLNLVPTRSPRRLATVRMQAVQCAMAFLRGCITEPLVPVRPSETILSNSAVDALDRLDIILSRRPPEARVSRAIGQVRMRALNFFLMRTDPYLAHYWGHRARAHRLGRRDIICTSCGTCVHRITAIPRSVAGFRRQLTICPRCGIIGDTPLGIRLSLAVEKTGLLRLDGDLPIGDWLGAIRVLPRSCRQISVYEWPRDTTGRALPSFKISKGIPKEPCNVATIIFHGLEISWLSTYVHGIELAENVSEAHSNP